MINHYLDNWNKVQSCKCHLVLHFVLNYKIYSESKRMTITNAHFTTNSWHFSANCMFIFHKNEVQLVILKCLTGLNLDRFKSYGLRCKWRPCACLANFRKIAIDKWPFYYHIWPFFGQLYAFFNKTEVQTVILRCLTSLNLNWYNSYDTKCKNTKNANEIFEQYCKKLKMEIFAFYVLSFEPTRF